ncbi:hypothetical protein PAXRUDRAFT_827991 [Paxillus rubicundulus Ve08.2h10]|uniref:Uncharacterized protein n=1 Tax=Paxillus rubicundulus Ve08.2h10 TaxID=930991 RepID=A0A0D0DQ98_9AGAM|nr:hypothetical protein PAXRUDRAFT_827991 [Paxillus rubicundulus Ve08.2h10]
MLDVQSESLRDSSRNAVITLCSHFEPCLWTGMSFQTSWNPRAKMHFETISNCHGLSRFWSTAVTIPPLPCKIPGFLCVVIVVCKPPTCYHSIRTVWLVLHKPEMIPQWYIEVIFPLRAAIARGWF